MRSLQAIEGRLGKSRLGTGTRTGKSLQGENVDLYGNYSRGGVQYQTDQNGNTCLGRDMVVQSNVAMSRIRFHELFIS